MQSNESVITAFRYWNEAKSGSMTSTGDRLFSYNTLIAEHKDGKTYFNTTKYSSTTSKQQTYCKRILWIDFYTTKPVPLNTQSDLADYV